MHCLGKGPARHDSRTLLLSKYLPSGYVAPDSVDWTSGITSFGTMLNNTIGDCVFAAGGHAEQTWTASRGTERTPPDSQILSYYEDWAGYVKGNPSTDRGYDELTFLNKWRRLGFCGSVLMGYADPDASNLEHIRQSIALFGGVYIGDQLPNSAIEQFDNDEPWTLTSDSSIAGGHALWLPKYDLNWLYCVTWGRLVPMSYDFFLQSCDEAHTLLNPLFINGVSGIASSGVDWVALQADLVSVTA